MSPVADSVRSLLKEALDPVDFAAIDIPALILDQDGDPSVNIAKYGAKWNWLPATPFPVTLGAAYGSSGAASAMVARPGVQGGDFEILGFLSKSTGRFGVLPNLQSLNLDLANTPMCHTLIMGKGLGGAPMCVSAYEPASGAINFKNLTNLTALSNAVRLVPYGRRFLGLESEKTVEARRSAFLTTRLNSFWVGPDAGQNSGEAIEFTLPAAGHIQLKCTLPTIGDFLAITPVDDSSNVSSTSVRPEFSVQITDGLTGYQLMPQAISVQDFVAACQGVIGTAGVLLPPASFDGPFSGLFTHLFARGGQIILDFYNDQSEDITVRFGFRGILIRYKPAQGRSTNTSAEVRASLLARSQPMPFINIAQGGRS